MQNYIGISIMVSLFTSLWLERAVKTEKKDKKCIQKSIPAIV